MELDVYCDPTAETPLYEPIGEDVNQGLYVYHITSKWACKENARVPGVNCSSPKPTPPLPLPYYKCDEKMWMCHPSAIGYNTSTACDKGCTKNPPPPPPGPKFKCERGWFGNKCVPSDNASGADLKTCKAVCARTVI